MSQVSENDFRVFQEKMFRFPGFYVQRRSLRQYVYPNAAHVLGDVAEVSKGDIENDDYYQPGDYIGKQGIERSYEKELRGEKGVQIMLRDARGRIKGRYHDGAFDTQIATTKWVTSNAIRYGVCSTSGSIQAKTVTCTNFTLATGAVIYIKFSNTNTVTSATLNVNGTGAKPIISNGSPVLPNILQKNVVYCFVYDETNWQLVTTINTASYNANGNTLLNSNFNNLILPGKYYVTTTRDTINAPISADANWWVEVSAYSDDSSVQILQEARMHSSGVSTTTSGPANVLVRCYDGTSWGTWTYSYSIFAG